jgi:hypothetical protein
MFALSMSEFFPRHSNFSKVKLAEFDGYCIKPINKSLGGLSVTKEAFYIQVKDESF